MMQAIEKEISLDASDEQMRAVLCKILQRDFYDRSGLLYGIGHAIYTLSDPRAEIIRSYCEQLAKEKRKRKYLCFLSLL